MVALHHRRFPLPLLPERRLVKRHRVPAHRRVREQPGNLAIFRQIDQPTRQPGLGVQLANLLILQPYAPAAHRAQAVERFGKFGTPGADQPGEADDLTRVDLKIQIDKPFSGQILHPQHREILRLGAAIARQRQPQLLRVAEAVLAAGRGHGAD